MQTAVFLVLCLGIAGSYAQIAGGISAQCLPEPDAKLKAQVANRAMNSLKDDGEYYHQVGKVDCVKSQVVEGVMYYISFFRVVSTCKKTPELLALEVVPAKRCPMDVNKKVQHCEVKLWSREWMKSNEIVQKDCKDSSLGEMMGLMILPSTLMAMAPGGGVIMGGLKPESLESSQVQEAAQLASAELNKRSNNFIYRSVAQVNSAKSQVVAGMKWYLNFYWADTTCNKQQVDLSRIISLQQCPINHRGSIERCDVEIVHRPWEHKTELLKFHCSPARFSDLKH